MRMIFICLCVVILIVSALYLWDVLSDKTVLQDNVIRLHIVANSDEENDQNIKLKVRDAIMHHLNQTMDKIPGAQEAKQYLQSQLPKFEAIAKDVLAEFGITENVKVTFEPNAFETRVYDTFTLPAGIYDSLRIVIGSGEGKNWWCVIFPTLCTPVSREDAYEVAVTSGLDTSLCGAITGKREYQVRFFLLDWFGKIQNFFFS